MSPVFPKDSASSPYRMQSHFHELLGNFLFIYPGFQTNPDSCPARQGQQPIWPEEPSGPELRVTHLKPSHPSDPCPWRTPGCCRWRRRAPLDQRETPAGRLPARDGWHQDLSLQQSRPVSPSLGPRGQNCGDSSGGRKVPPPQARCVHRRPTDRPTDTSLMQTYCQARIGKHTQALAVPGQGLLYTHFLFLLGGCIRARLVAALPGLTPAAFALGGQQGRQDAPALHPRPCCSPPAAALVAEVSEPFLRPCCSVLPIGLFLRLE